jgi:hypothetical protein
VTLRRTVSVVAVITTFAVVIVAGRGPRHHDAPRAQEPAVYVAAPPAPTPEARPSQPHDLTTATNTALSLLKKSEDVVIMNDADAAAAQRAMATDAARAALVERLREQLAALHRGFPGRDVRQWVAPVAVRAWLDDAHHAGVAVWFIAVVSPPSLPTYQQWWTITYHLAWERGGWYEAEETETPGPRPATLAPDAPSRADEFAGRLDGFHSVAATRG